jgi:hypothetical protein
VNNVTNLWGRQLFEGFGSVIAGFQPPDHCRDFIETVESSLDADIDRGSVPTRGDRRAAVGASSGVGQMAEPMGVSIAARRDLPVGPWCTPERESLVVLVQRIARSVRQLIWQGPAGPSRARIHVTPMSSQWVRTFDDNYTKHGAES